MYFYDVVLLHFLSLYLHDPFTNKIDQSVLKCMRLCHNSFGVIGVKNSQVKVPTEDESV